MPPRGHAIRPGRFKREMKRHNFDSSNQLAIAMGVNRSTVGRVLSGKTLAGPAFTDAACKVFGLEHGDLFVPAPRPKATKAAA